MKQEDMVSLGRLAKLLVAGIIITIILIIGANLIG